MSQVSGILLMGIKFSCLALMMGDLFSLVQFRKQVLSLWYAEYQQRLCTEFEVLELNLGMAKDFLVMQKPHEEAVINKAHQELQQMSADKQARITGGTCSAEHPLPFTFVAHHEVSAGVPMRWPNWVVAIVGKGGDL